MYICEALWLDLHVVPWEVKLLIAELLEMPLDSNTVEPRYNEDLGTMKITLL